MKHRSYMVIALLVIGLNGAGYSAVADVLDRIEQAIVEKLRKEGQPLMSSVATVLLEERTATLPQSFALFQNYPNPFNSSTMIRFAVPQSVEVELALYNLAGQKMATRAHGPREAGTYSLRWDSRDNAGWELASGVYLYRLLAGDRVETRKLLLLR